MRFRLLNANKINCLRVNTFQDLQNLNLLSLYDNKLQTISKGLFTPLRSIKTLYVYLNFPPSNKSTVLWQRVPKYRIY